MNNQETIKKPTHPAFPFEVFEEEMISPIFGHDLSETELFVANLLLDSSSEKPIKNKEIIRRLRGDLHRTISERQVKEIIRLLRRNHAFPILSRRGKPAGYYWCNSVTAMEEFIKLWRSQYLDEITTLSKIVKNNYPRLAGQMRFADLEEQINADS